VPSIAELEIADDTSRWEAAGFRVAGDVCDVSRVRLRLAGSGPRRGILGWTLAGDADAREPAPPHPNGAVALDHVVMLTPDLDRTVEELEAQGFDLRRVREGPTPGGSTRQAFFRAGEPILEVVQAPEGTSVARDPAGPARLWGLAFEVEELDETARALGELLGAPRDAVQPGRRIATLRGKAGLGPAIAFMTPGRRAI
jgi:Glyoxalase-like domain